MEIDLREFVLQPTGSEYWDQKYAEAYLTRAFGRGRVDPAYLIELLGNAARARGLPVIAEDLKNVPPQSLRSVFVALEALGLSLSVQADMDRRLGIEGCCVEVDDAGNIEHYEDGQLYREDGPAQILTYSDYDGPDRDWRWYRDGELHREGAPAVICGPGPAKGEYEYEWWNAGFRHRLDGPAVIHLHYGSEQPREYYEWWVNGVIQKVQQQNGAVRYYKQGELALIDLPDGGQVIFRDSAPYFIDYRGRCWNKIPDLDAYEDQTPGRVYLYSEADENLIAWNSSVNGG